MGQLGAWLIGQLMAGEDAETIVAKAEREASENATDLYEVTPVFGAKIGEAIELTDGARLIPASDAPSSWHAQRVANSLTRNSWEMPSQCLLVQDARLFPAFAPRKSLEQKPSDEEATTLPPLAERVSVRELVRASFLLLGTAVTPVELPAVRYMQHEGRLLGSYGLARGMISPPSIFGATDFEGSEVLTTFRSLKAFSDPGALLRAIDRLGRSRTDASVTDKAIDLGMAMELALMHGSQSGNSEIRYKVSMRAAWLVGGDFKSRAAVFREAQLLYDARSKAVHSGVLPVKSKFDALPADRFVSSILVGILGRKKFPVWDELTLGVEL